MKNLILLFVLVVLATSFTVKDYECTHEAEVLCIDDINKAIPICQKAAQEKGADVPADLECMKYFAGLGEDCWDCICWVAQTQKIDIFGC